MNVQLKPHDLVPERRLPFECVALVLQGGGALGAYQAGVYEALAEAGIHPDWVAGVSIGAINAAIAAGNPPNSRVDRLREFLDTRDHGRALAFPRRSKPRICEGRCCAQSSQPDERELGAGERSAWIFRDAACGAMVAAGRNDRGDQFLRYRGSQAHARASGGFRPFECWHGTFQRRSGQRSHGQFRLFRHDNATAFLPSLCGKEF